MPRYYFHVRRGQITALDREGIELADAADAEVEASTTRAPDCEILERGIVEREFLNGQSASRGRIIVADDNWRTLCEFPF